MDRLVDFKNKSEDISYNDLFIKAAALALQENPQAGWQIVDDQLYRSTEANIGLAVALDDGLIVPVVRNADKLSLKEISVERKRLVNKAREGSLDLKEITDNVCTISNLGNYGIDVFTPILNPPETVIFGIGRIMQRPWVEDGALVVRNVIHLSITFDHQIIDGAVAASFLGTFCILLDDPSKLASN